MKAPRVVVAMPAPKQIKVQKMSVRAPVAMVADIGVVLDRGGLSIKQRSKWIDQAISVLSNTPEYWEFAAEDFIKPGTTVSLQFSLQSTTAVALSDMARGAAERLNHPVTASAIVRTAITQRLLQSAGHQLVRMA